MSAKMTFERAEEFGAAWNSRDADLVASFFAEDGVYHASVGPDALGKTYIGKDNIRRGVQAFFDRSPDGKFENLKVVVAGARCFRKAFLTATLSPTNCRRSQPAIRTLWPLESVATKSHSKVPMAPATTTFRFSNLPSG